MIIWNKSDKTGLNWIKSDQVGSNWFKVDQLRLILTKFDQTGSNQIKEEQPFLLLSLIIGKLVRYPTTYEKIKIRPN